MLDIRNMLKKYGSFIYTGDKIADLEMMEMEIRELYQSQLLEPKDYQMALLILMQEMKKYN
ncbi:YqgQ family protein [Bacillus sp. PS06]|uniref:YqgQ family protein n=1 Tax=Bacillus sp. PS06 TaxID=2764176 RepID=UPI00178538DC|nr:YqgQ family protein [Bacillus sp. PS06]MBD8071352.1 YqgQ family protein [Bacillus sp. PS06]